MASTSAGCSGPPETIGDLVKARRWEEVGELLAEDPELSFWTDPSNARTPLHIMCRMDLGEVSTVDTDGEVSGTEFLPAHVEVAQMLIDASHECEPVILPNPVRLDSNGEGESEMYKMHMSVLTVRDYLGDTPLHNLCGHMRSACPYLVQLILSSASDSAAAAESDKDNTISDGDLVEEEKIYSRAPSAYELLTAKNTHGCTALHFIGDGSATWDISKVVIDSCRSIEARMGSKLHPMLVQDEDGDTPLHFACSAGMDPSMLRLFLDSRSSVVHVTNNDGRLPVDDLIVWFVDECDSDVEGDNDVPLLRRVTNEMLFRLWQKVEVLLRAAYNGQLRCEQSGVGGFRPLHAAASAPHFPSLVLRLACMLFPDEVSSRDENGFTSLHVASSRRSCEAFADPDAETYAELVRWGSDREDESMIAFLSSLNPDSTQVFSNEGRLPLHLAIENGQSIADIQHLLSLSPHSLEATDMKTKLRPFMLAAVGEGTSLDSVHLLLLRNPELVRSGIERQLQ
eukprot:CAMPEP_0197465462 /NCGR_PEP_ID=MMETSP1175-20131217/64553_1 /TAXON_ID=1003142 /ORGANISM="Triceratium dubium, Strain CCMP147" /LENGTH=511 /DNA_ID=CAMNT_0043001479 /DNA_START=5 /DNA_END=1540 /DNA_ORIENTATION=+